MNVVKQGRENHPQSEGFKEDREGTSHEGTAPETDPSPF
jgi:hypothetical protein